MRSTKMTLWLVALLGLAACGEESPVELGGLLPGGGIRSAEAVFDAAAFLEWDSVRTGFLDPRHADFIVAAEKFEGELDAHGLLRLHPMPRSISYTDTAGTLRVDTLPDLVGGRLTFRVDTLGTVGDGPIKVSVYHAGEEWDLRSANWTSRVDTASVKLAWAEPGGTRGDLISSAQLVPGDSILGFQVDRAALELLRDSVTNARGVLLQVETPGSRLEVGSAWLRFESRPAARPDTLIADSVGMSAKTFLLNQVPDPDAVTGALLVGGLPTWRSYLRFKEGIDTLPLPCPGGPTGCTLALSDVVVNYAGVELQRVPGPPGFALLDTVYIVPRAVLPIEGVPIARVPLGVQLSDFVAIPPSGGPAAVGKVEVPVTVLITSMAGDSVARERAPRTLSLIGAPEGASLGVAAYGSLAAGPLAPRLRLIYSVTKEVQVP
jgi:hypothetical protein